ncbi:hypothetical protein AUEXF2481DRAFT_29466 [Aureobasidium subglaciale EXF-2481]|uniref:Uncharacterized protein n=1 Tax=Aureobasidium subglaciale (strain EXF-2481) TaxID=1043005 RepID=A0A074YCB0_AURSE|nr:uncharacterized protein AUEXF2481DRAFT_29466 [Aureobasidium subglaciale EXF-2481]KAI5204904.1 hypothetical protein E4T38_04502 [Aureobasidium subglaciale]KAI5223906.1 hypothetical protein E4T40_04278 [Aureobasidium subglaciale]KAI5227371.1 hypothetical protein E4T41_04360 [Aureobasidium subglaciale]KAI5262693.1 hypothetical protein E4T46_04246 [Aureobasidium subglaciale]KEQ95385.1 hypothetical protein AUEXF2481DRAFT_29466 [Aureobasidium subglaciale EXF-2481]
MPDYHPVVEKYGLQVLEAAGFLNDTDVQMTPDLRGQLAIAGYRNPEGEMRKMLHPVFRRDLWTNASKAQFAVMQPSILLATAILDDPVTLCYFHALTVPAKEMETLSLDTCTVRTECKVMEIPEYLTAVEQNEILDKLCKTREWIQWTLTDSLFAATGQTNRIEDEVGNKRPASSSKTAQSMIEISSYFTEVLLYHRALKTNPHDSRHEDIHLDTLLTAGIKPSHLRSQISLNSSMNRTIIQLTITLLHEFTHAFTIAWHERQDSSPSSPSSLHASIADTMQDVLKEPFCPGNKSNEQGFCFENYIFGGVVKPIHTLLPVLSDAFVAQQMCLAVLGLSISQTWDIWAENDGSHDMGIVDDSNNMTSPLERGNDIQFPVPAKWVSWLVGERCWGEEVQRFGLQVAVKVPKVKGWGVVRKEQGERGVWGTGEERWGGCGRGG